MRWPLAFALVVTASAAHAETIEGEIAKRPVFSLGVLHGVGGVVATTGVPSQPTTSGFRLTVAGPGEKRAWLAAELDVYAAGWLGTPRPDGAAQGALFRFVGLLPLSSDERPMRFGFGYTLGGASARVATEGGGTKRVDFIANAILLRLQRPFGDFADVFVEWDANIFSLVPFDKSHRYPSPMRAGGELRLFDRAYVRAHGSWALLGSYGFGWQVEAGARF